MGLTIFHRTFSILCGILSVPHNVVMDLNNVMDMNVSMLFFYRLLMHVMQYKVYCLHCGRWPLRCRRFNKKREGAKVATKLVGVLQGSIYGRVLCYVGVSM